MIATAQDEMLARWGDYFERQRARQDRAGSEVVAARAALSRSNQQAMEAGRATALAAMGLPAGGATIAALLDVRWTPLVNLVTGWASSDERHPFLVLRPEDDQVARKNGLGAVGAGKSVAACTILFRALRRFRTWAHPADSDAMELEAWDPRQGGYLTMGQLRMASRFGESWHGDTVMDRACRVRYLVLDELRACDLAGVGEERLEELVEARNRSNAWTVITSNLGSTELGAAVGPRVVSRWTASCARPRLPAPVDYRRHPEALRAADCPVHGVPAMRREGACACDCGGSA